MSVNGIELKEGQIWKTKNYGVVTLSESGVNANYPWRMNFPNNGDPIGSITTDGKHWEEDETPELLECIYNPESEEKTAMTNKFKPKPGDKIICNNGEEFVCCTLETLISKGFGIYFKNKSDSEIFGMNEGYSKWMYWNNEGYPNDFEWNIREVIPQNAENSADKEEEAKEEPLYTLQEIKEAWDASGWVISTSAWEAFQKNLTKINSPEYQEYLRLRAIYE